MGDQSCPLLDKQLQRTVLSFPCRSRNTEIFLGDETFNLHYKMLLSETEYSNIKICPLK